MDSKKTIHRLNALDNGHNVETRSLEGILSDWRNFGGASNYTSSNDVWGEDKATVTTAHWAVCRTWDYYNEILGRKGLDGNGGKIRVCANTNEENSSYVNSDPYDHDDDDYLTFGRFSNGAELNTVDICGHEFTHGVINYTSKLINFGEQGALAESFGDIFGNLSERYALGQVTWQVGEDNGSPIRSLSNPGQFSHPSVFTGAFWVEPTSLFDNGGIHINCGVQNFWFFLLANGGTQNGVNVQSIGIDKAAQITYYSMVHYIQSYSNYNDARQAAISAARNLFGACSNEERQVTNAWAAVGVGAPFVPMCIALDGDVRICPTEFDGLIISASIPTGATVTWSNIPPSWNYVLSGPGNSILEVVSISPLPPPNGVHIISIQATCSLGGTATHRVFFDKKYCESKWSCRKNKTNTERGGTISQSQISNNQIREKFELFPNPVTDEFTIFVPEKYLQAAYNLEITDLLGRPVLVVPVLSGRQIVNVSTLTVGQYYIRIITNHQVTVLPFIKSE